MLKHTILLLAVVHTSLASTYSLDTLLRTVADDGTLTKSLQQKRLALEAKNRANTASEPIALYAQGTRANPLLGSGGYEHTVGVTKKFMLGSIQEKDRKITRLANQAYLLDEEKSVLSFNNTIKNIYHHHCLDRKNYRSFYKSYQAFKTLYTKKEKAFAHQEISKVELMQLAMEKKRLYAQLQALASQKEMSKKSLFILSNIPFGKSDKLSCKDLYPIRSKVKLNDTFALSNEAYRKRIESTQKTVERYSSSIDSIDISTQYTKELDMDRYTVGVSIPLNFTSSKNEQERVAAMYENTNITLKHEQNMREKKSQLSQLRSRLKSTTTTLSSLQNMLQNYQKNLLPLMKKSYDLGETSVIEYLLNRQKSYELRREILNTQKTYYSLLFELYTLSEQKDHK